MERAVDSVLKQVGQNHRLDDLNGEGLIGDEGLEIRADESVENPSRRRHREKYRDPHEKMAHEEMKEIGSESPADDRKCYVERSKALERYEEECENQKVENEPIEPDEMGTHDGCIGFDPGAA